MIVCQRLWEVEDGWRVQSKEGVGCAANAPAAKTPAADEVHLVLAFAASELLNDEARLQEIRSAYPGALIAGCSTAGEIHGDRVRDGSISVTSISFRHSHVRGNFLEVSPGSDWQDAGDRLVAPLRDDDLRLVVVLAGGLQVNGSQLARGISARMPGVPVVGGLAGDGMCTGQTLVFLNDQLSSSGLVAIGLYGDHLEVGCGSLGGWDPFGPERRVTRSRGNVLFELDGQSALSLYRKYLGPKAAELPSSALLFPLSIRLDEGGSSVVRTVTSVSDEDQSLTFAGDVPEGAVARLMRATFERLIDGAVGAAESTLRSLSGPPDLALLISCVGRKLVLKQRIEEEIEGVREIVGEDAALAGFYSLGEISPFAATGRSELHNQTMTVTGLREV